MRYVHLFGEAVSGRQMCCPALFSRRSWFIPTAVSGMIHLPAEPATQDGYPPHEPLGTSNIEHSTSNIQWEMLADVGLEKSPGAANEAMHSRFIQELWAVGLQIRKVGGIHCAIVLLIEVVNVG
jgi:hypothetical protein